MRFIFPLSIALGMVACAPSTPPATDPDSPAAKLLPPLNDPFEPVNRSVWAVNKGLLVGVIQPTGEVYRTVVPRGARTSVSNFSRNITYPGRLINNSLQGRWQGAGDETLRFLTNTTVGVAGLFDVASKWNIPKSDASFGQTFTKWGWKRGTYIMLPIAGPSDEVNATAFVADKAAEPWTWLPSPYTYGTAATSYNEMTETSNQRTQFVRSDADSYHTTKYFWSYRDPETSPDWKPSGPPEMSSLQTLQVAQLVCADKAFPHRGHTVSVRLPSTGKVFKATTWMQKEAAPVIYITPGLGSHRISSITTYVAELLYNNGYSVVSTSSIFHPEFIESALTSALPAYPPNDSTDLLTAITAVDRHIEKKYPNKITARALLGLSMGGFQTLHLAARENKLDPSLVRFDRYVAVNPPVELDRNLEVLDRFYSSTHDWPAATRIDRLNNTVKKLYALQDGKPPAGVVVPFDGVESRFLIGLTFRFILRDTIFSTQYRQNLGIVKTPLSKWRREPSYDEIMNYSFADYFQKFAVPYYRSRGVSTREFSRASDLRSYTAALARNNRTRVITNRNDFLLAPDDASWLASTFPGKHNTIFPSGGHLGNLSTPEVEKAILASLEGIR